MFYRLMGISAVAWPLFPQASQQPASLFFLAVLPLALKRPGHHAEPYPSTGLPEGCTPMTQLPLSHSIATTTLIDSQRVSFMLRHAYNGASPTARRFYVKEKAHGHAQSRFCYQSPAVPKRAVFSPAFYCNAKCTRVVGGVSYRMAKLGDSPLEDSDIHPSVKKPTVSTWVNVQNRRFVKQKRPNVCFMRIMCINIRHGGLNDVKPRHQLLFWSKQSLQMSTITQLIPQKFCKVINFTSNLHIKFVLVPVF